MTQINFMITLLQDVVISEHSATVGNHTSLDYLPGNVFLGLLAAKHYATVNDEDAWTIFHSGKIRFHDALPLTTEGQVAWPVPLSLHAFKSENWLTKDGQVKNKSLFDVSLLHAKRHTDQDLDSKLRERQPEQMRRGYLTASGKYHVPERTFVMKTAIDPDKNTAATGQLFGYQSIKAGQRYYLQISADDDVSDKLADISQWISGTARLGRSRSAQFGQVEISLLEHKIAEPECSGEQDDMLTFWLLSDLALVDEFSQPTLQPKAQHFALPAGAELIVDKSYIRSREYSPYNGKRRSYDSQRQVICRGSVLRFKLPSKSTIDKQSYPRQYGLHQASGLGWVLVNPKMLSDAYPVFENIKEETNQFAMVAKSAAKPDSLLINYLLSKHNKLQGGNEVNHLAEALFREMLVQMTQARVWLGLKPGEPFNNAPSTSQWSNVLDGLSGIGQDAVKAEKVLFSADNAIIGKRENMGWDLDLTSNKRLCVWLHEQFKAQSQNNAVQVFQRLAKLAQGKTWRAFTEGKEMV